jgi:VIT1/CCC1 family predicted Fe2+/Mn2+ transporter
MLVFRPSRAQHQEAHATGRAGWLRAAVLGANDGLVSTASLILGVASAGASRGSVITAGVAGLVAGAMSMAAGEYVSVSSQRDSERADLVREQRELDADPIAELEELTGIYEERGLSPALAREVAEELSNGDALAAHARDELGITDYAAARPLQAAVASAFSFAVGAIIPLIAVLPPYGPTARVWVTVVVTVLGLIALGAAGAILGKAPVLRASARVLFWGVAAMAVTSLIGALVGTAL